MTRVIPPKQGATLRGFGVAAVGAVVLVASALVVQGCNQTQPFQCGVRADADQNVVRSCDGPNEICVCWTHYCARKEPPTGACTSGYRYRNKPFGPEAADNKEGGASQSAAAHDADLGDCVPAELTGWLTKGTQLCAESKDAPDVLQDTPGTGGKGGSNTGGTSGGGGNTMTGSTSATTGDTNSTSSGGAGGSQ